MKFGTQSRPSLLIKNIVEIADLDPKMNTFLASKLQCA